MKFILIAIFGLLAGLTPGRIKVRKLDWKQKSLLAKELMSDLDKISEKLKRSRKIKPFSDSGNLVLSGDEARILKEPFSRRYFEQNKTRLEMLNGDFTLNYRRLFNLIECIEDYQKLIFMSSSLPHSYKRNLMSTYHESIENALEVASVLKDKAELEENRSKKIIYRYFS